MTSLGRSFGFVIFVLTATATPILAQELPQARSAETYLGDLTVGENYKILGNVRSDGLMHIYFVETPYGRFQIIGDGLMKQRIQELRAMQVLEQMSRSEVFAKSFGQAATAPLRFGVDLIVQPGETINRSLSGVGNMFDQFGASVANSRSSRDNPLNSALGIDAARRQLAVGLSVDPYTDFAPLAQELQDVASAAALGGISIKAAFAVIPGGVGFAISSSGSARSAMDSVRDKTSAQIIQEVRTTLRALNVSNEVVNRLVENRAYTPTDLLVLSKALERLNAANTTVFIDRAAQAGSRDVAFFQRRRAELLAEQTTGISEFILVAGFPLNRTRTGAIWAVFPLDEVLWTSTNSRAFTAVAEELRRGGLTRSAPTFATNGIASKVALSEMSKLGWKFVQLK